MPCTEFTTWNPVLNLQVLQGQISAEELLQRTLHFTFIDRQRDFSHIEWRVVNQDGAFTHPETMGAGMVIAFKLGYIDATTPWRTMIINRMRGGVGAYGRENAVLGDGDGEITLFGRNRNASGGSVSGAGPRGWRPGGRAAAPAALNPTTASGKPRKARKVYKSTLGSMDMILNSEGKPKVILQRTTSGMVKEIARRWGFKPGEVLVEDTNDHAERFAIPAGRCDAEHMQILAEQFGFSFYIDEYNVFHWHSPTWAGDYRKGDPVDRFRYGGGPDILRIGIDADFTLPFASSISVTVPKVRTRELHTGTLTPNAMMQTNPMARYMVEGLRLASEETTAVVGEAMKGLTAQSRLLVRPYNLPGMPTDHVLEINESIRRKYLMQLLRGFQLTANCVGNPRLLAGRLLQITGAGSIFLDGTWMISEARHTIQNSTSIVYGTDLRLLLPPPTSRGVSKKGPVEEGHVGSLGGAGGMGRYPIQGRRVDVGKSKVGAK